MTLRVIIFHFFLQPTGKPTRQLLFGGGAQTKKKMHPIKSVQKFMKWWHDVGKNRCLAKIPLANWDDFGNIFFQQGDIIRDQCLRCTYFFEVNRVNGDVIFTNIVGVVTDGQHNNDHTEASSRHWWRKKELSRVLWLENASLSCSWDWEWSTPSITSSSLFLFYAFCRAEEWRI